MYKDGYGRADIWRENSKKGDLYKEETKLVRIEDINIDKIELSKKKKIIKKWSKKIYIYIT